MENFILAVNVVLPIALIMLLGSYLKKIKMLDDTSVNKMNRLAFRVFMGMLIFINVYNIRNMNLDIKENIRFLLYPITVIIFLYIFAYFYYYKKISDRKEFAVIIQGVYRGNFVLFGLPVAESIYGDVGISKVSMLISLIVPIYNVIAVLTLEYYSGKNISWKKILKSTITNPLIVGSLSAICCIKFGIELPKPIYKTLFDLAKIATPLSFVILGASLRIGNIIKNLKKLISINFMKLIVNPFLTIVCGYYAGFSGPELVAFLAMSACPTAVSSFTMAKEMNVAGDLAGEIVASTTIFSIFTIFSWVIVLKSLAWI
ncbi:AEC family transporter [Fusobacterium russii]|uniref:AEC family transporter n=1 Tax=Fusobacterium russii TaxID=854 RepID=UPI0003A84AB1|nr:AEC family transporter [Fusobacterium russii]